MYLKITIFLIAVLWSSATLQAQDLHNSKNSKVFLDFGGAFSVFLPFDQYKGFKQPIGSNSLSYLQLTFKDIYSTKLKLGQTSLDYKGSNNFGTLSSITDTKINSTNIGLDFGYQKRWGKWLLYVFGGAGAAFIQSPKISYQEKNATVNFTTGSTTNLYLNRISPVNWNKSRIIST